MHTELGTTVHLVGVSATNRERKLTIEALSMSTKKEHLSFLAI